MRLNRLVIKGFRSLRYVDLPLDSLTSLIGRNGSGKSSVLDALDLLFAPKKTVELADFWQGIASEGEEPTRAEEVSILATFCDLSPEATDAFGRFVREGSLTLERIFPEPGEGGYYCSRPSIPAFARIRSLPKGHKDEFNALVDAGEFEGLDRAGNKEEGFAQMDRWERDHADQCEPTLESVSFFSHPVGSPAAIGTYVSFIFVGALEAPEEHLDATRTSGAIGRLIGEVVQTNSIQDELDRIAAEGAEAANALLERNTDQLAEIETGISEELAQFAPGFALDFRWEEVSSTSRRPPPIRIAISTAEGLRTDLRHQGQGVQRSLMYAALAAEARLGASRNGRTILLAIEEPEAFQHPLSARVLGRTLSTLSNQDYQIVYSTHSPDFVRPQNINGLRLVRRAGGKQGPSTNVSSFSLQDFAVTFGKAYERDDFTPDSIAARLEANLETRILEGLFANACVIVEGDEDEALLRAACRLAEIDLDERGVAVIQARGKLSMPLVLGFLKQAGVPCYPVFDLDRQKEEPKQGRVAEQAIVRLLRGEDVDLSGSEAKSDMAYWEHNLGLCVSAEMGHSYEGLLTETSQELGYVPKHGKKVAPVLSAVLARAKDAGLSSHSLQRLVDRVRIFADTHAA